MPNGRYVELIGIQHGIKLGPKIEIQREIRRHLKILQATSPIRLYTEGKPRPYLGMLNRKYWKGATSINSLSWPEISTWSRLNGIPEVQVSKIKKFYRFGALAYDINPFRRPTRIPKEPEDAVSFRAPVSKLLKIISAHLNDKMSRDIFSLSERWGENELGVLIHGEGHLAELKELLSGKLTRQEFIERHLREYRYE
ncbi:MAG: hypothetical protein ABIG96_05890 [Candidatus Micrarchaeota archaeon]